MARGTVTNFGYFVRQLRLRMQLSRTQFIAKAGIKLSERRLWQIEMNMPEPKMHAQKFEAIARALGFDRDELDRKWKSTPVAPPTDAGKTRKNEMGPLSHWLSLEASRLHVDRARAMELLLGLLQQISDADRDMYYTRPPAPPLPMSIPRPAKDTRLRPAAKTIGAKTTKSKP